MASPVVEIHNVEVNHCESKKIPKWAQNVVLSDYGLGPLAVLKGSRATRDLGLF